MQFLLFQEEKEKVNIFGTKVKKKRNLFFKGLKELKSPSNVIESIYFTNYTKNNYITSYGTKTSFF